MPSTSSSPHEGAQRERRRLSSSASGVRTPTVRYNRALASPALAGRHVSNSPTSTPLRTLTEASTQTQGEGAGHPLRHSDDALIDLSPRPEIDLDLDSLMAIAQENVRSHSPNVNSADVVLRRSAQVTDATGGHGQSDRNGRRTTSGGAVGVACRCRPGTGTASTGRCRPRATRRGSGTGQCTAVPTAGRRQSGSGRRTIQIHAAVAAVAIRPERHHRHVAIRRDL